MILMNDILGCFRCWWLLQ